MSWWMWLIIAVAVLAIIFVIFAIWFLRKGADTLADAVVKVLCKASDDYMDHMFWNR